jgi:hypothetical protein
MTRTLFKLIKQDLPSCDRSLWHSFKMSLWSQWIWDAVSYRSVPWFLDRVLISAATIGWSKSPCATRQFRPTICWHGQISCQMILGLCLIWLHFSIRFPELAEIFGSHFGTFIILTMSLLSQQRSIIRYFVLRGKSNQQIAAKLAKGYGWDALCLRAVRKWATRFRAGKHDVEDDDRFGRPHQTDLCDVVLRFIEKTSTLHYEMSARRSLPQR